MNVYICIYIRFYVTLKKYNNFLNSQFNKQTL